MAALSQLKKSAMEVLQNKPNDSCSMGVTIRTGVKVEGQ